jgi:hypothetical protein
MILLRKAKINFSPLDTEPSTWAMLLIGFAYYAAIRGS